MKAGYYGILPAEVRYDKRLSAGAKLLYAEITANVSYDGRCIEDYAQFAAALRCDYRTIHRYVISLLEANHIFREKSKSGNRLLCVPSPFNKISLSSVHAGTPEPVEEYGPETIAFFEGLLKLLENGLNMSLDKKEMYYDIITDRLSKFTKDDLIAAAKNRINFVQNSSWHNEEANRAAKSDIMLLLKDDSTVLKYLNMKTENKQPSSFKPLKFN